MSVEIPRLSESDLSKLVEACRQFGRQASLEAYGEQGADLETTLADLERQTGPLFDAFLDGLLGQAVSGQAERLNAPQACPHCGRECEVTRAEKPRVMQTDRGQFAWHESRAACSHCQRAFFPSASGATDRRSRL